MRSADELLARLRPLTQYVETSSGSFVDKDTGKTVQLEQMKRVTDQGLSELAVLIQELMTNNAFGVSVSLDYLMDRLRRLVIALSDSASDAPKHLEECKTVMSEITTKHNFCYYIPVSGIEINIEELPIGKVSFFTLKEKDLFDFIHREYNIILDKDKLGNYNKEMRGTFAKYQLSSLPDRATFDALNSIEAAVDCLQFMIRRNTKSPDLVNISIRGFDTSPFLSTLRVNEDSHAVEFSSASVRPAVSQVLSGFNALRKGGYDTLNILLSKGIENLSQYETTLLRAISWYSNATRDLSNENSIINFVFVLEMLIKPLGDYPISKYIAENLALMLAQQVEQRIKLYDKINELYNLRSKIVHNGKTGVSDEDVEFAEIIAYACIASILKNLNRIKSKNDLQRFFKHLRLARESGIVNVQHIDTITI